MDNIIKELEEIIVTYELCVKTSLKEIEENGNENEMTFEICALHNNRGYLEGIRKALEIVKSAGAVENVYLK